MISKQERYEFRKIRSRNRLFEHGIKMPRLSVYRGAKHIYAQVVDDIKGVTLAAASSVDKELKGKLPAPIASNLEGILSGKVDANALLKGQGGILGMLPGMEAFATSMMKKEMEKLDIPPIGEFIEMIRDAGCEIYACKATVDMFHLTAADFCPQMDAVISVGQFYEKSAGAQIIFT